MGMTARRYPHLLACGVAVVLLAGCAVASSRVYAPDVFAHRIASQHAELYWSCSQPEPGILRMEGVVQNPWGHDPIRFVEFDLVGVDAADRMTASASGALADILVYTNGQSAFRLDLRTTGREVRYDLFYQYRYDEPEFDAALRPVVLPRLAQQLQRHMVRDACAAGKHRSR